MKIKSFSIAVAVGIITYLLYRNVTACEEMVSLMNQALE